MARLSSPQEQNLGRLRVSLHPMRPLAAGRAFFEIVPVWWLGDASWRFWNRSRSFESIEKALDTNKIFVPSRGLIFSDALANF
jgi:hypothetical protein